MSSFLMRMMENVQKQISSDKQKVAAMGSDYRCIALLNEYHLGNLKISDSSLHNVEMWKLMNKYIIDKQKTDGCIKFKIETKLDYLRHRLNFAPVIVDLTYSKIADDKIPSSIKSHLDSQYTDFEYYDIEFFEYTKFGESYDASGDLGKLEQILGPGDHNEERIFIKEYRLSVEKEKIHFKILKCKNKASNQHAHIPIFIGIGTNEPFGFSEDDIVGKKRWLKMDFEGQKPYSTKGKLKIQRKDSICEEIWNPQKSSNIERQVIDETVDATSKTAIVIGLKNKISVIERNNRLVHGFIKVNLSGASGTQYLMSSIIGRIVPDYNTEYLNFHEHCKNFKSIRDLLPLLVDLDNEYLNFMNVRWNPYNIINEYGSIEVLKKICNRVRSTHQQGDFNELLTGIEWDNIHVIAGDLSRIEASSQRNKISALIAYHLIDTGEILNFLSDDKA